MKDHLPTEETSSVKTYIDDVGSRSAKWLRSKHTGWVLGVISFAESLFAPIIIDPFLIAAVLAKREAWVRYSLIAISFSVLGGFAAYILGVLFYDAIGRPILEFYNLGSSFDATAAQIDANGFVFVLLGALTPIPYKLVAIAAGFLQMNILTFIFASIIGRFLRLGLVGLAAHVAGPRALQLIRRHLLTFAYVIAGLIIVYFLLQLV